MQYLADRMESKRMAVPVHRLMLADYRAPEILLVRHVTDVLHQRSTGQVVVNLARRVAKKALMLRTLASCVNRVWLMLR